MFGRCQSLIADPSFAALPFTVAALLSPTIELAQRNIVWDVLNELLSNPLPCLSETAFGVLFGHTEVQIAQRCTRWVASRPTELLDRIWWRDPNRHSHTLESKCHATAFLSPGRMTHLLNNTPGASLPPSSPSVTCDQVLDVPTARRAPEAAPDGMLEDGAREALAAVADPFHRAIRPGDRVNVTMPCRIHLRCSRRRSAERRQRSCG